MENHNDQNNHPVNPRRRKRTKFQIFKETYLPAVIAGIALLLIIVFIIGSITRSIQRKQMEKKEMLAESIAASEEQEKLDKEAADRLNTAASFAVGYDYENAILTLNNFSGNLSNYPDLLQRITQYENSLEEMVLWDDPSKIINLSFQLLIEDPSRAFNDSKYGSSYKKNFITTSEFRKILHQLYENDYILIRLSDVNDQLKLPKDKKPIILTQTQVNYYTYMTDSDGDKHPDAGGAGFASKLFLDATGNLTNEIVDTNGQIVTGAFDMVPILEAFIETHPDFTYKGARAILAVTGYDGLFGYRTNASAKEFFGNEFWEQEVSKATEIVKTLRNTGYEIACYTYENVAYGSRSAAQIRSDLDSWNLEVSPILGVVDTLAYARESDIANSNTTYSGDKYTILKDFGFTNYLGFCTNGAPWISVQDNVLRQGRILVTGKNLTQNAMWFNGIFDSQSVLDPSR